MAIISSDTLNVQHENPNSHAEPAIITENHQTNDVKSDKSSEEFSDLTNSDTIELTDTKQISARTDNNIIHSNDNVNKKQLEHEIVNIEQNLHQNGEKSADAIPAEELPSMEQTSEVDNS